MICFSGFTICVFGNGKSLSLRIAWDRENLLNLYVGNLSFNTTEDDVREAFAQHGAVSSVRLITDRETGRSRGFGFVEMDDAQAAQNAMTALNGADLDGRALTVNEARPREPRRDNTRSRW